MSVPQVHLNETSTWRRAYFRMNLDGPWQCDFCGIMIDDYRDVDVHHRDGDKSHNDFANLVAGHHYCHVSHHASNRTPEHKARISAKLRVVR